MKLKIVNVLKDGREIEDITGHVVKMDEADVLYKIIGGMNKKRNNGGTYEDSRECDREGN